jgi:aminoglycoside phosphotransferase (APT) family kinase protein
MKPRPWNEKSADRAVKEACTALGLPVTGARLVRLGSTALYRLGDLALRIAPPGSDAVAVAREIRVAEALLAKDIPAVQPFGPDALCLPSRAVVSLWRYVEHDPAHQVPARAFGKLLRQFHEGLAGAELAAPELEVKKALNGKLDWVQAAGLVSSDDVDLLRTRVDSAVKQLKTARSTLGSGILHGDAHPGNVIVGDLGPVWCDFERVCRGPFEWDLIPTALRLERFGMSERDWDLFADGYGYDVRSWEGYQPYLQARALSTTLFALVNYPRNRQEAETRLRYWRRADSTQAPAWSPI